MAKTKGLTKVLIRDKLKVMRLSVFDRFGRKQKFYLTKEGLEKIKREHKILKKLKQSKVREGSPTVLHSDELAPEYLAFKEDLDFLNLRITELENVLKNVELIKTPPKKEQDRIHLGSKILIELDGQIDEFIIVGTLEADPAEKKISDESPIGEALLGRRVGETVAVKTPIMNHLCKIIKIKYGKL